MKKILFLAIILAVMAAVPFAVAETNETGVNETREQEMEQEMEQTAGIGPNSPFYGLERSMERLRVAFTFRKAAKTELKSRYAEERLAEAYKMIKENRIEQAEKAKRHYNALMEDIGKDIEETELEGNGEEINNSLALMRRIENKQKVIEWIGQNIKIKVRGNLTKEQQEKIDELLAEFNETADKIKIDIDNKVDKWKIAAKARGNLTDEEVNQMVERVRERVQKRLQEHKEEIGEMIQERVQEREEKREEIRKRIEEENNEDNTNVNQTSENQGGNQGFGSN
ncbi:hypothetical protein JW949_03085 [Candidatus Woesearchaeota archaeon]|nr:hypothetical protein [Candidatus Woesearchaeota archaeon]